MTDASDLDVDTAGSDTTPAETAQAGPVRAAGGVVWRRGPSGIEVVLIHRSRYDDWSLPKGKVDPGENDEQAARREVQEEASVIGVLGPELRSTTYVDRNGRDKMVRYWAMTVAGGNIGPDNEIDVAEWLPIGEARRRLTYDRDRPVLDSASAVLSALAAMTVADLDHVVELRTYGVVPAERSDALREQTHDVLEAEPQGNAAHGDTADEGPRPPPAPGPVDQ